MRTIKRIRVLRNWQNCLNKRLAIMNTMYDTSAVLELSAQDKKILVWMNDPPVWGNPGDPVSGSATLDHLDWTDEKAILSLVARRFLQEVGRDAFAFTDKAKGAIAVYGEISELLPQTFGEFSPTQFDAKGLGSDDENSHWYVIPVLHHPKLDNLLSESNIRSIEKLLEKIDPDHEDWQNHYTG